MSHLCCSQMQRRMVAIEPGFAHASRRVRGLNGQHGDMRHSLRTTTNGCTNATLHSRRPPREGTQRMYRGRNVVEQHHRGDVPCSLSRPSRARLIRYRGIPVRVFRSLVCRVSTCCVASVQIMQTERACLLRLHNNHSGRYTGALTCSSSSMTGRA
jgi:hypothetical protein